MRSTDDIINQQIFDYSVDLILVTDSQGNFIRVSPSSNAILGYQPSEMIGRTAVDFIYPADLENTRAMMRAARLHGVTRHFECRYVHKNGIAKTLVWTGVWVPVARRHFFIGRDVTSIRIDETFMEISKLIDSMYHQVSNLHEKIENTPLPDDTSLGSSQV